MSLKKKTFKFSLHKFSFYSNKKYTLIYGNYGIQSLTTGLISPKNLENLRRKLSKQFKKLNNLNRSKFFFIISFWKGFTKKPMLSRMGKGAGTIDNWKTFVKQGSILMEISTPCSSITVFNIFKKSVKTFPLKLWMIKKRI